MSERGYRVSDVEVVLHKSGATSWDDAIHWLREQGGTEPELGVEPDRMAEDFAAARDSGAAFVPDPEEVLRTAGGSTGRDEEEPHSTPFDDDEVWPGSAEGRPEITPDDAESY